MRIQISRFTLVAAAAFLMSGTTSSFSQTMASEPSAQETQAATTEAKSQARKDARAKRKAERKTARAKNTAELKKLEDAGYKPGDSDLHYPQNVQDAEKKAGAAAGASQ